MATVTLETIHKDILSMKKELHEIKSYMKEDELELTDETKKQITESRNRDDSEFISQEEIERKFL
ncbi:hypothetical protein CMO93_06215 [Candidatus Woesearchaeota archaeon]|nr:hypothetical protein [Candidatus Woesearchaeota archaeon]|tara:strand:+ start:5478 stop:5672 length:195 start_codon:yes stop_codon:yes gene_type:complete